MELKKGLLFLKQHPFLWLSITIGVVIFLPIINASYSVFTEGKNWQFVVENRLLMYLTQSVILVLSVLFLSTLFGVYASSIVSLYDFKGSKILSLLLFLPLAMPSYVMAFIYQDIVREQLKGSLMNLMGAIIILSISLFPYVYLTTRAQFKYLNTSLNEAAKLMKMSTYQRWWLIHLPMLKPGILTGVMFVVFETLNDYGTVSYFNVKVLSVGIFETWFGLNDRLSGLRLSWIYVGMVIVFMSLLALRKKPHISLTRPSKAWTKKKLNLKEYFLKVMPLWGLILMSFIIPVLYLIRDVLEVFSQINYLKVLGATLNSLILGSGAAWIIMVLALVLANANRFYHQKFVKIMSKISLIGYVLPGVLIALMYYVWFIELDHFLNPLYALFGQQGLVLSLSIIMLLSAYVMRFLSVGYNHLNSNYRAIGTHHTLTSYVLKKSKWKTLYAIDIPMLKWGILTGFLLVLVDSLKELSMTLILRPFNYHALSTLIYQYVMDEQLAMASAASLILIGVSASFMVLVDWIGGKRDVS
jgi:iron(III) transport system permease protein